MLSLPHSVAETPQIGAGNGADALKQEIRRLLLDFMRENRLGQARFAARLGVRTGKVCAWVNARRLPSKADVVRLDTFLQKNGQLVTALADAKPVRRRKRFGADPKQIRVYTLSEYIAKHQPAPELVRLEPPRSPPSGSYTLANGA